MANTDFSPEQVSDIKASYRNAANPEKQIGIQAELYDTTENAIRTVLGLPETEAGNKKTKTHYDAQTRQAVIKAVLLDGVTTAEASEQYGVKRCIVGYWVSMAKKQQSEFNQYAAEVEAEQAATPAAAPENKTKKTANPGSSQTSPAPSLAERKPLYERVLREVNDGVNGFDTFLLGFIGIDIFNESEEDMLDNLSERIHGFRDGLKTGIELMKEEAKSNARDS